MADFSFFDQFEDIQVDLTAYLKNLSVSGYDYRFEELQPVIVTVKDLFTHYKIVEEYKKNIDVIFYYNIKEGESADAVSYNVYGTIEYWWIIYIFNNITCPCLDWPFSQSQLAEMASILYNEEGKYTKETYFKFLEEENENKRKIIVPKPYVLRDFIWSYRKQIEGI